MSKMSKMYKNTFYGIMLTGFLTFGGIFITPLLLTDYFFPKPIESIYDFPDRIYDISFSFHNISSFLFPINSLQIAYREFNSSYLNYSDPFLVAVWFFRNSPAHPEKENFPDNCTTWRITPFPGRQYNQWNVCTTYATDNPPIYVHDTYIVFEVMLFSELIFYASKMPSINFSTLGYEKNPDTEMEGSKADFIVPDQWVLSITLTFENHTSIVIDAHKDGWLEYTKYIPYEWTAYGDEFTVFSSGITHYMEFNENFNEFHQTFSDYVKTHIKNINTTNL